MDNIIFIFEDIFMFFLIHSIKRQIKIPMKEITSNTLIRLMDYPPPSYIVLKPI